MREIRVPSVLRAEMNEAEYEVFKNTVEKKQKRLLKSLETFKPETRKWVVQFKWSKEELDIQSSYCNIPFRMEEKGDFTSTVATSGCAILIAKFFEKILVQRNNFFQNHYSVEELAKLAVENGYRGYKMENGVWKPTGMKHVFFDRFIPSLYGFEVERASSINCIFESLRECGFPVLLLANSIYKENPHNKDSHFVVVCGYDDQKETFLLFDPEYSKQIIVPYSQVIPAIRNAWIVYE